MAVAATAAEQECADRIRRTPDLDWRTTSVPLRSIEASARSSWIGAAVRSIG